jgi:Amt family ammonium transporter
MIDSGNTAWILVSTALVMLMTPGVGLFYGGMVREKNVVSIISLSFISLAIVSIQWILIGYSLSFAPDVGGFVGGLDFLGLRNVQGELNGIPHLAFMAFQLVFAAITLAILTSAIAERVRIGSFLLFGLLWTTLIYNPFAHWLWGGGWLAKLGALDFAGGTVVHISSGFSALALAMVIGKRREFGEVSIEPHNIPMTLLGGALLWFGWFGFNGGSALAANGLAANAIVVTNVAAMVAAAVWMFVAWAGGKPGSLSIVSGAIAGLAAVTPAAGFIGVRGATIIGLVAGIICYKAMDFRIKAGLDESLDAWAIHGIGGLWGSFAIALFANKAISGYAGIFYGSVDLIVPQFIAVAATVAYAFVVTYVLAKLIDATIGLRVSEEEEYVGLDISQHGEVAYA